MIWTRYLVGFGFVSLEYCDSRILMANSLQGLGSMQIVIDGRCLG